MNTCVNRIANIHRVKGLVGVVVALMSASAMASDTVSLNYQLLVIENQAYGRAIKVGKHSKAIDRLVKRNTINSWRFSVNNNLCVAYTMDNNVEQASYYCDRAIDTSETKLGDTGERDRAIALSNRGVLRAITGDTVGAGDDFIKAVALEEGIKEAITNLARYELIVSENRVSSILE